MKRTERSLLDDWQRILFVIALCLFPRAIQGQSNKVDSQVRYMIVKNAVIPTGQYSFVPEDLGPLVSGRSREGKRLGRFAKVALERFRERFGHAPIGDLDKAVAVADWIAQTMKNPYFWPTDPAAPRYSLRPDPNYDNLLPDPLALLDYTLQFDPEVAETWPSPQCGQQNRVVLGLLNALGVHGRWVAVQNHIGLEFFSFQYHKWIYIDSTHNEHYVIHSEATGADLPLGVAELHALTLGRRLNEVNVVKHGFPGKAFVYMALHPEGFRRYAVPTFMKVFGEAGHSKGGPPVMVMVSEDLPRPGTHEFWSPTDPTKVRTDAFWFELKGVRDSVLVSPCLDAIGLAEPIVTANGSISFMLRSSLPYTSEFQQSNNGGKTWLPIQEVRVASADPAISSIIVLNGGSENVRYRAQDTAGNVTQEFIIYVE